MAQPPIHLTGNPNIDWLIFIGGLVFALYWLRALRLARQGVRFFIRNVAKAIIVFAFSTFVLSTAIHMQALEAEVLSFFIAFLLLARWQNAKRSRYISAATKRDMWQ